MIFGKKVKPVSQYISNFEVWRDGKPIKWGNQSISSNGDADSFGDEVRRAAAEACSCEPQEIRIVGVFKL